jgi:hypothetical protein
VEGINGRLRAQTRRTVDFNYVKILSQGVRRHLHWPHRFVCLTDSDLLHQDWYRAHGIQCRRLLHDWGGDWPKLELFRSELFMGRVIYLDLDLMVTGSLFELGRYNGRFAMTGEISGRIDTSVMMWRGGDLSALYYRLAVDPVLAMDTMDDCAVWISAVCRSEGIKRESLQDLIPDLMTGISPVIGGTPRRTISPGIGLVSFRGSARPHVLADGSEFIRNHWV